MRAAVANLFVRRDVTTRSDTDQHVIVIIIMQCCAAADRTNDLFFPFSVRLKSIESISSSRRKLHGEIRTVFSTREKKSRYSQHVCALVLFVLRLNYETHLVERFEWKSNHVSSKLIKSYVKSHSGSISSGMSYELKFELFLFRLLVR